MIAPNILWNVNNGFVTFSIPGTISKARDSVPARSGALGFIGSQFGIIGPVIFTGLLIAAWLALKGRDLPGDRVVIAFALPVNIVVAAPASLRRPTPTGAQPPSSVRPSSAPPCRCG